MESYANGKQREYFPSPSGGGDKGAGLRVALKTILSFFGRRLPSSFG
jgi:hypothetical protein